MYMVKGAALTALVVLGLTFLGHLGHALWQEATGVHDPGGQLLIIVTFGLALYLMAASSGEPSIITNERKILEAAERGRKKELAKADAEEQKRLWKAADEFIDEADRRGLN